MKNFAGKFLISAWLWAAVPTLVISFFIKDMGRRYSVTVEGRASGQMTQEVFIDLNGDGITEHIHAKPGPPLINMPIMDNNGKYFDQWNLSGDMNPEISTLYFGNFDRDSFTEIYVFTAKNDSIFLNVNEFFEPGGIHLNGIFITQVNLVDSHIDSNIKHFGFFDQNKDGKGEFYFRISTGFGLWPRLCYFYDLANQTLTTGRFTGINFNDPMLADIDGDKIPEVFSHTTAPGNYDTPTPYTDYSAWLMVLNDQLGFKFPPVEFPGFGGSLNVFKVDPVPDQKLLAVYNFQGTDTLASTPRIMLYKSDGKVIKEKTLTELGIASTVQSLVQPIKGRDRLILLARDILIVNTELVVVEKKEMPFASYYYHYQFDLNNDGLKELFLFYQDEKKLVIYDHELNLYDIIPFVVDDYSWQASNPVAKTGENKLFIKSGAKAHFLTLKENPYYLLKYLIYPAIYFGFFIFIMVINKVTTAQIEKLENQKRKLQTLQLQSIKGQLDPHFTFNALNSVAALLYLDDRDAAYDYLNKFTRLLRQLLSDAERIYRRLDEEIEFVTAYLNLEKLRFGEKFNYEIHIGENITQKENVPVMVLQTFAENSVKHGLMPLTNGGKLIMTIEKEKDYLKLTIEDNGVGRKRAAEVNQHQGKGLRMISEFYKILNQINKNQIHYTITDLHTTDGTPAGTRAEVWVPQGLR